MKNHSGIVNLLLAVVVAVVMVVYMVCRTLQPAVVMPVLNIPMLLTLSVAVKNTGSVAGKEIVQLYVGDEKCSLLRPQKELKHFDKILLQPGEEKTVTFTITPDDLKFYDDRVGRWVAEPGKFKLYVGASSTDIRGTATFELL